jgi:peptidyl-prolyl cis-trans isomerase SurA
MRRRPNLALIFGLVIAGLAPIVAQAAPAPTLPKSNLQMEMGIAAVVNDEVISGFDLDQRVRLVVSSSGVQPSKAELTRIRAQVLRNLIDEKLKLQEAKRLKVDVKDQDVVDQLKSIAEHNGMTVADIRKQLKGEGISIFTLTDQIKAEIAWQTLVQGRYGSEVNVSDQEIQRTLDDIKANVDKPQYRVVEIFLPVDSPDDADRVKQQADDLIQQLGHGAKFDEVAQQFSQAPTAANGGDVGWVTLGQLPKELDGWLEHAHRGQVTMQPIRTLAGYYILGVADTRNVASAPHDPHTPMTLKRILVPLNAFASAARSSAVQNQLISVARKVKGCATLSKNVASLPGAKIVDLGTKTLAQLDRNDQARIMRLAPGEASPIPVRTNEGWETIVLCSVEEGPREAQGVPSRQEIRQQLREQQLSMISRRYLRDLRRDAIIDTRIGQPGAGQESGMQDQTVSAAGQ